MRGVVILNPASGRGTGAKRRAELLDEIAKRRLELEVLSTNGPKHALDLARQAAAQGIGLVAACGGDGTLNEVVNGIFGSSATFAALPMGTGNDFCRELGFGADWRSSLDAIEVGRIVPIDVGYCRSAMGLTRFINIAGCGFDVEVAIRINSGLRKLKGTAAYIAGVLGTFARYRAEKMTITIDGTVIETEAMLCAVANATSYGGAMRIAPHARIDDGILEVVIVEKTTKLEFLGAFPRVFKGTHLSHARVKTARGTTITIETPEPRMALVDGELFESTPITFGITPAGMPCIVPESFRTSS